MPLSTAQSKILSRASKQSARSFNQSKKVKAASDNRLPPGINNGIAVFSSYDILDRNGMPRIRLSGKILEPAEFDGQTLSGRTVTIDHDLADLKDSQGVVFRTYAEAEALLCSDIKKLLGGDADDSYAYMVDDAAELADLIPILDELVSETPKFTFRTWASKKSGYVNSNMNGYYEDNSEETEEVSEEEYEEPAEEEVEEEVEEDEVSVDLTPGQEVQVTDDDGTQWDGTIVSIDNDDYATVSDGADEWETLISQITPLESDDDEEIEEEDEEDSGEEGGDEEEDDGGEDEGDEEFVTVPEKGDIVNFRIGRGKPKPYQVTSVSEAKQTVNLKGTTDGKIVKGVAWDRLED